MGDDEVSCDVSHASSNSFIDDIRDFDPDAVDFEPLLVSGTGRILTYHRSSYCEDEEGISVSSSTVTPIAGNNTRERTTLLRDQSTYSSRFIQSFSLLVFAALMVAGGLSLVATDTTNYTHRLQTVTTKFGGTSNFLTDDVVLQRMMNVDAAVFEASSSQVVLWEPYLDHAGASVSNVLVENTMTIMVQCFGRSVSRYRMDETTQAYQSELITTVQPPQLAENNSSSPMDRPAAIFTPNFKHVALELFDQFRPGAFITIMHDPVVIYMEQYTTQLEGDSPHYGDNLLVRHLAGIEHDGRAVTDNDLDIAVQILRSKFVIGSCNNPETLQRLVKMIGSERGKWSVVGDEKCASERKRWNQECRRMNEIMHQNEHNKELVSRIESEHHYDILLYEESKKIFREQNALFNRQR